MIQNHCLAQHIADVAWGTMLDFSQYKAEWNGKTILQIGRFEPSSKTCSCGWVNADLKLSDRVWTCPKCKTTHDRDVNAARNIKRWALHPENLVRQGMSEFQTS
jgi:putative transposase